MRVTQPNPRFIDPNLKFLHVKLPAHLGLVFAKCIVVRSRTRWRTGSPSVYLPLAAQVRGSLGKHVMWFDANTSRIYPSTVLTKRRWKAITSAQVPSLALAQTKIEGIVGILASTRNLVPESKARQMHSGDFENRVSILQQHRTRFSTYDAEQSKPLRRNARIHIKDSEGAHRRRALERELPFVLPSV